MHPGWFDGAVQSEQQCFIIFTHLSELNIPTCYYRGRTGSSCWPRLNSNTIMWITYQPWQSVNHMLSCTHHRHLARFQTTSRLALVCVCMTRLSYLWVFCPAAGNILQQLSYCLKAGRCSLTQERKNGPCKWRKDLWVLFQLWHFWNINWIGSD